MHAQAVKQSVCLSVVVVVIINTKITRSHVLGICVCCKHNQSADISEKLVCTFVLVTPTLADRIIIIFLSLFYSASVGVTRTSILNILVCTYFKLLKRLTSATNGAFSVQHACGLSTTPTLLA